MATFLLLNGPNLNLLGTREPEVYGQVTLEEIKNKLEVICEETGNNLISFQSNAEHELVEKIQEAQSDGVSCIIFNPGAFTHSSIALRDALNGTDQKFIEVHISNIYGREDFRQKSFLSDIAEGVISGLGAKGYELALEVAIERFS
ncbi:MAG: type II 3-dehydroquinate dehydratase [Gammaproteobacteria bacterium]